VKGRRYTGLHVLVDDDPRWSRDPIEQASAALSGGAPVIQLRAKHSGDRETLVWARAIRELTRERGALLVVNDRFDLALASDADAVHLGQDDLPPASLPAKVRDHLAVGRSTHSLEQVRDAVREDLAYIAYGPVFPTQSKETGYSARGLEALGEAVRHASPNAVVAIGGIRPEHLKDIVATGAKGIAIISAIAGAESPETATRNFVDNPVWTDARELR
jgi:thiamine-phosphate pyrophosphorylase